MPSMKGHLVKTLPVAELKAHFSDALRQVESGGRIIVERRGKPVAVLVPLSEARTDGNEWWRELDGIAADVGDFEGIMREVVRSRRKARTRRVDLEG